MEITMNFALFTHVPWPEGGSPARLFAETIEQAALAEEIGFRSVWIAEHHFSRYSLGSSSLVLAAAIAARTQRIRLGTGVLIPTLHNPIRLAEDTATLDCVSGGRLDVGFGRGTFGYEYGGFGIDERESQARFQESVAIIQGLWTTPEFSHSGEFYQLNKLNLAPPPHQTPHPPIYIAASYTQETLDFLIRGGHKLCIAVVQDTQKSLELCQRYLSRAADAGVSASLADAPFFRYFYVAETEERARQDTQAHINWILDIMQWRRAFKESSEIPYRIADWRRERADMPLGYDYILDNRAFIGTPDHVSAQIAALRAQGIEYFGCNFAMGGIPHEKVLRSMRLFTDEVMPRFA